MFLSNILRTFQFEVLFSNADDKKLNCVVIIKTDNRKGRVIRVFDFPSYFTWNKTLGENFVANFSICRVHLAAYYMTHFPAGLWGVKIDTRGNVSARNKMLKRIVRYESRVSRAGLVTFLAAASRLRVI